jgi:hypothetical protein
MVKYHDIQKLGRRWKQPQVHKIGRQGFGRSMNEIKNNKLIREANPIHLRGAWREPSRGEGFRKASNEIA